MAQNINELSIEEKLGQLFMSTYENDSLSVKMINLLTKYHIGGILLTRPNYKNRKKLTHLTSYLQYYATKKRPLLIASRQDHHDDLVVMPEEETLHKMKNRLYTKQLSEVIAVEHRTVGINTLFYPNLDANDKTDLESSANHGVATVQGMKKGFVVNCVSGFPSLNEINLDKKPDSKKSIVYPFYKIIKEDVGLLNVKEPSEPLINGYIRNVLGYENVIIHELTQPFTSVKEIANYVIEAIHAGVNMIILPYSYKEQMKLLNYLIEVVKEEKIDKDKINDSFNKLKSVKEAYRFDEFITSSDLKMKEHHVNSVKEKVRDKITKLEVN